MILTVPDFLKEPEAEREAALKATYETHTRNGITYRGIAPTEDGSSLFRIALLLRRNVCEDNSIVMWRRYLSEEENETYIHVDSNISDFTGILFLSDKKDCKGGTAFWTHKETGFSSQPTEAQLNDRGMLDSKETWDKFYKEGFDEQKWEMNYYCPMVANTLILFPSGRFHSRFPKQAFGTTLSDSRLVKVFFVKCLN